MENTGYILEMNKIQKSFPGVRALKNANLKVRPGQVHALIGENGAGKSTLMNILLGIFEKDEGEILFKGEVVHFKRPYDALKAGISMIHQEIRLIPTTDVAENIWLGRENEFSGFGVISERKRYQETEKLLTELEIHLDPKAVVNTLSVANMQLVELARAVSYKSDIIIMDEPTSSLTNVEIELLYSIIRKLTAQNKSVIFISHKLEELFEICDEITVMRDGQYIATHEKTGIAKEELISEMAGRTIGELFPKQDAPLGETVLEVKNLSSGKQFKNINFTVKKGEILGFCGLVGSGRSEIMRAIFGADRFETGEVRLDGQKVLIRSPKDAISHGLGMVTEDRLITGIVPILQLKHNISLSYLNSISPAGIINKRKEDEDAEQKIEQLSIKTSTSKQMIQSLSGGNQQKAIIARWLLTNPKILILDEPTRGIDVGAKSEIHRLISSLTQQGLAVILISSELPEVIGMSDRIIVIREGEIAAEVKREEANQELLLKYAFGIA